MKNTFEHITVEQGLSQSAVLSIAQDSLGFMWFGTKDGLNRYDSKNVEVYRSKSKDPKSLSSSININTLLVDSKGFLWIGTQHGLNKYLAESDSFQQFLHRGDNPKTISNEVIRSLFEDNEGNVWVGTEKGLNKVLPDGSIERFEVEKYSKNGLTNDFIKTIYQDRQGIMWLGTTGGLVKMTNAGKTYKFKFYESDKNKENSISGNDISSIIEDYQGNLWIGTRLKGFNLFDRNKETFVRFDIRSGVGLSSDDIRKITVDKNGKLWIATLGGVNIFNPLISKVEQIFVNEPENPNSLSQNSTYDIYQDKLGSMWIGTYFGGLNITHTLNPPFTLYQHFSYKNSLSSNIVSAMVEDGYGNLWIGTEGGGLNYLDRKTGRFKEYKHTQGEENSLSSNLVKDLALDAEGNLWATTFEGGLNVYNPKTGKFRIYKHTSSLKSNRLSNILIDSKQKVWVGSRNGLFIYDSHLDIFKQTDVPHSFISSIYEDSEGRIWVASDTGLFLKGNKSNHFVNITLKDNPSWFLRINAISEDSKGKIWFATHNGILVYSDKDKTVKLYTENQGLPTNSILGVIEDNQKNLWFSTTKGLVKFEKGIFKTYNTADGLAGNVFNFNSFLKGGNGELFFGGFNGMISFRPEDIKENKAKPTVILTGVYLPDKVVKVGDETEILKKAIWDTPKIGIPYKESVFSLDFAVLNYISPNKNKYAYKLEGIDKQWIELQSPNISFNKLSDGEYILLVRGSNNDGVWSDIKKLKITIYPPFWKSWWAYLFYLAIIAGIGFVVIRYFIMEALLKKEHEVHQLKVDFFRNVSHEIRTPLTLILGPIEKLIGDPETSLPIKDQLSGVNKHVKRLTKLINELLDFSKVEAGKMKLRVERVNLVDFTHDIYQSFQYKARETGIQYRFSSAKSSIEAYIDKAQLEKVFYNLLSNAFKFTPNDGRVDVTIEETATDILVRIIDSGKGIGKENKEKIFTNFYQEDTDQRNIGTGIGLALSKSIAKLHKGDLIVEDDDRETIFCLSLKKGFEHLNEFEIIEDQYEGKLADYDVDVEEQENEAELPSILVIEDNKEVRDFVVDTLKEKYSVLTAENGSEGLKLTLTHMPDIVISDVMMPVMDGIAYCRAVKSDERINHIPVVLLTARTGESDELEGLKIGADAYMTKPFTIDKLKYTVSNLVALQEAMRSKFTRRLSLEPNQPETEHPDNRFIEKVLHLLEENIGNPNFGVNDFASEIGMSTPIFYKKIKAITGLTVNNFMKSFRLKRALQLMEQKRGTISEIAYNVGFTDPKYFSKEFKKQFGKTPTEFISCQYS
ncbi:hybrid sensor histidine kinase/response regulator transcription factor [Pseudopedobacter saltans]|nr:hybrid sensor histidine kinase/response regulator transcription factor [Pseudopedobacter saltans]